MFFPPPPPPENRTVYEIIWRNVMQPDRPQANVIRRMRIACWITKATDTHSECVIITAFSTETVVTRTRLCYVRRALAVLLHAGDGRDFRHRRGD